MSKTRKILFLVGIMFFAMIIFNFSKVDAATASISGNQTVTQGTSVTVTGTVNAGAWNMVLSGAGQNKGLAGQTSVASNQSASTSITFTASTVGSYTFTFSGDITDFNTDVTTYPSSSCTITVVAPNNNSGNTGGTENNGDANSGGAVTTTPSPTPVQTASLTNLGIRPHDFSGFRSAKTSYTANVPNDCTSVEIYASANAGQISGTGTKTLKEGSNPFTITVTNGSASKSYTLNVIRATSGEDLDPNHPDEEPNEQDGEEENSGIGLATLEISGITFDKQFETGIYEYTVKVKEDITVDYLEEIKSKIVATTNTEGFKTEITVAVISEKTGNIMIAVKDDEREYSKYIINFEKEEKEETPAVLLTNMSNNSSSGNTGIFGLPFEFMIGLLILGYGVTLFFAVLFAVKCYLKDRELEEYAEHEFGNGEDMENPEYNPISGLYNEITTKNEPEELDRTAEIFEETEPEEKVEEVTSKLGKLAGYRNLRGSGKTSGRHF